MKTEDNNNKLNNLFPEGKNDFTGGFSVPENYFEKLEGDIREKASRIPNLYTVKKENPFAVPAEYFTELENSVREKISLSKERAASAPFFLRPRLVPVMAMTFVIAVCAVTVVLLSRNSTPVSEKDISFSDIYHSSYVADFDEDVLAELVEDSALNSNTSHFENYIIEENTDIQTLTEEL
jgi:hypothetical protein